MNTDLFSKESIYFGDQWHPAFTRKNCLVVFICLVEALVRMIQSTFAQFPTTEDGIDIMPEDEERFMVLAVQVYC